MLRDIKHSRKRMKKEYPIKKIEYPISEELDCFPFLTVFWMNLPSCPDLIAIWMMWMIWLQALDLARKCLLMSKTFPEHGYYVLCTSHTYNTKKEKSVRTLREAYLFYTKACMQLAEVGVSLFLIISLVDMVFEIIGDEFVNLSGD